MRGMFNFYQYRRQSRHYPRGMIVREWRALATKANARHQGRTVAEYASEIWDAKSCPIES
jgi:hypothetical protein